LAFKRVNVTEGEFTRADCFNAFHDFDEPASVFRRFLTKEERPLPTSKDSFFWLRLAVSNERYFSRIGNLLEQDIAADPARALCCGC
jgi:hypothetical protein